MAIVSYDNASRLKAPRQSARINRQHRQAQGLVLFYPMLEGHGLTVHDYSGYGNHGTMSNMELTDWKVEDSQYHLDFGGTNEHINGGTPSVVDFTHTDPFSISIWVKNALTTKFANICIKSQNTFPYTGYWLRFFDTSGNLSLQMYTAAGADIGKKSVQTINDGVWHHVGCTYDGSTNRAGITLYIDGLVAADTDDLSDPLGGTISNSEPITFGGNERWLIGQLRDARVYNRELRPGDMLDLFQNPWAIFERKRYATRSAVTGFTLEADAGSYSYQGSQATLKANREIVADSGTYTYTGTEAGLLFGFRVVADGGTYTYTGTAAGLLASRVVVAGSGTYTYTGTAADLLLGFTVVAGSGTYTYTGSDATLQADRILGADSGTYTYTGSDASLEFGFTLAADSGTYTYTGTAAGLLYNRVVVAGAGTYTYTGSAATLTYSAVVAAGMISVAFTALCAGVQFTGLCAKVTFTVDGTTWEADPMSGVVKIAKLAPEEGTYGVQLDFTDEDDTALTPDTLTWSLYTTAGAVVNSRSAQVLTPASSVDVVMSGDDLAILSATDNRRRRLTIEGTFTSDLGSGVPLKAEAEFGIADYVGVS